MKTPEEVFNECYLEDFKYTYKDESEMSRHLQEIAVKAMRKYADMKQDELIKK